MIQYVIAENPDSRVLDQVNDLLKSEELVCFPTDTSWVVAGRPDSKKVLDKIYRLKNEEKTKHFSLLCPSISKAQELAEISDMAFKLIRPIVPGHYTFIFPAQKKVQKILKASKADHEIGVRFTPAPLCQKILEHWGDSLISTNITAEMLGMNEDEDFYGFQIDEALSHTIGLIVDPGEFEFVGPSSIVSFMDDQIEVLREGAGDLSRLPI